MIAASVFVFEVRQGYRWLSPLGRKRCLMRIGFLSAVRMTLPFVMPGLDPGIQPIEDLACAGRSAGLPGQARQ
ncbi:hypothetical protein BA190_31200 [Labrys sp. WJW]|nr:hypothetical protein BA190_31200 [Labrys sp. WJW]